MHNQSTRPHTSPNQQTSEELILVKKVYSRFRCDGLAEEFVQLKTRGYTRSCCGLKRTITRLKFMERATERKLRTKNKRGPKRTYTFPGELVQVDIKYVPRECLKFKLVIIKLQQLM